MRTWPSISVECTNSAWPAPSGHHSTRQWLKRSVSVLPPSELSRMNEFSPVMRTSLGSTGGVIGLLLAPGNVQCVRHEAPGLETQAQSRGGAPAQSTGDERAGADCADAVARVAQ